MIQIKIIASVTCRFGNKEKKREFFLLKDLKYATIDTFPLNR